MRKIKAERGEEKKMAKIQLKKNKRSVTVKLKNSKTQTIIADVQIEIINKEMNPSGFIILCFHQTNIFQFCLLIFCSPNHL